ncbi:MAG: hypothetical protein KAI26_09155, partial [Nanoarchaeota archaeon]|nr:hypothetical protein [Nanoarchaeota archaeon]
MILFTIAILVLFVSSVYAYDGTCCDSVGSSCYKNGITGIAAGGFHTCFLLSDGDVTCQGDNGDGQSTDYTGEDAVGVAAGGYHACFLLSDGNVTCQGWDNYGQPNDYTEEDAVGVAAGYY